MRMRMRGWLVTLAACGATAAPVSTPTAQVVTAHAIALDDAMALALTTTREHFEVTAENTAGDHFTTSPVPIASTTGALYATYAVSFVGPGARACQRRRCPTTRLTIVVTPRVFAASGELPVEQIPDDVRRIAQDLATAIDMRSR